MLMWLEKRESLARGLLAWIALVIAILAVVFSNPALIATDSDSGWIVGVAPFAAAFLGYLFYRRSNPAAALVDIGRDLTRPNSAGRGWVVGIVVSVLATAGLQVLLPTGLLDRYEWLVWGPMAVGAMFGYAAFAEPNPIRAGLVGLRRTLKLGLLALGIAVVIALAVGGVLGLRAFIDRYGMIGIIAVLLAIIVFQLERLIAVRRQ